MTAGQRRRSGSSMVAAARRKRRRRRRLPAAFAAQAALGTARTGHRRARRSGLPRQGAQAMPRVRIETSAGLENLS